MRGSNFVFCVCPRSLSISYSLIVPPLNLYFVCTESLSESALAKRHSFPAIANVLEDTSIGDHGSIVHAISIVHSTDGTSALCCHLAHHFL